MNKSLGDIIASYSSLKGEYQSYHTYMQVLHDYFFVSSDNVTRQYTFGNEIDFTALWDATSLNAVQVAVAGVHSYLTPPNNKWFDFGVSDKRLEGNFNVRKWLNDASDEVFYVLNRSNFDQQVDPFYATSFVYGTAAMFSEEDMEDDVRFKTLPIKDIFMVEDDKERVIEYYMRHQYTPQQAVAAFGLESLSDSVKEDYKLNKYSSKKTEYCHYVGQRGDRDVRKKDNLNMPWMSQWIDITTKHKVKEGGYREDPFGIHRFYKRANIVSGFSPCMDSLPFVRTLNTIVETNLIGAQTVIRPPLDVPDQGYLTQFNLNPGALNIRRNSVTRDQAIRPIITGAQPQIGIEFQEMYRKDIRQTLFNDIFMAFADITKQMTVPEVREKISEKMSMLGPAVGRYQTEFLQKTIHRVLSILIRKKRLPPMPDELLENPDYKINFISPLALAQKSNDIAATQDILGLVAELATLYPSVLDKVNSDMVVDVVAQARGTPMEIFNDKETLKEIRDSRAQMEQIQQDLAAAQQGVDVQKTSAEADKNAAVAVKAGKE